MHYLAGTDSVHTTAAICDYLADRATAADVVTVVAVVDGADPDVRRDRADAVNVARARLTAVEAVRTDTVEGDPATALADAAADVDADELVIGPHGGGPTATRDVGSTARALLESTTRPVVVVPVPDR